MSDFRLSQEGSTSQVALSPLSSGRPDLSILLVEDDDLDAYLFEQFLDLSGSEVAVRRAMTLGHAMELARSGRFLLIFVDLHLADAHGPEIVRSLSGAANGAELIALTGSIDPRIHRRCVEAGAREAASKEGLSPKWLRSKIDAAIDGVRRGANGLISG